MRLRILSSLLGLGALASLALLAAGPLKALVFAFGGVGAAYLYGVDRARAGRTPRLVRLPGAIPRLIPLLLAVAGIGTYVGARGIMTVVASGLMMLAVAFAGTLAGYRTAVFEVRAPGKGWRRYPRHYLRDVIYGPTGFVLAGTLAEASLNLFDPASWMLPMLVIVGACGMIAVRDEPLYFRSFDMLQHKIGRHQLMGGKQP
jgi:hypothetical protein